MKNSLATLAILAAGSLSQAQQTDTFQVEVSRTQGDVACATTNKDGGSSSCQTSVKEQAHLSITMTASSNGKGYVGTDKVDEAGASYVLVAVADDKKQLKDIILMRTVTSGHQVFDGSLAMTAADSLMAVNVSPMHIEKVDEHNAKVQLSFVAYAPASDVHDLSEKQNIVDKIVSKMQPVMNTLNH